MVYDHAGPIQDIPIADEQRCVDQGFFHLEVLPFFFSGEYGHAS
jgi:hypothetical protein